MNYIKWDICADEAAYNALTLSEKQFATALYLTSPLTFPGQHSHGQAFLQSDIMHPSWKDF